MTGPNRTEWTFAARDEVTEKLGKMADATDKLDREFNDLGRTAKAMGQDFRVAERATDRFGAELRDAARAADELDGELADADKRTRGLAGVFDGLGSKVRGARDQFGKLVDALPTNVKIGVGLAPAALLATGPAAVTGALLGTAGAGLATGIALAASDPKVTAAYKALGARVSKELHEAAKPFVGPLVETADIFGDAFARMEPAIDRIFGKLAGKVEPLADGLAGFAEKAMPGIEKAVDASLPLVDTLAAHLPDIGDAVSKTMEAFSDPKAVEGATKFLDLVLDIVEVALPAFAQGMSGLSQMFNDTMNAWDHAGDTIKNVFLELSAEAFDWAEATLLAAKKGLGWMDPAGLSPKIDAALAEVRRFADGVDAELGRIPDERVDLYFQAHGFGANPALSGSARVLDTGFGRRRAAGGRAEPGQAYIVGDGGKPELLVMGDESGYIHPDARQLGAAAVPQEQVIRVVLQYPDGNVITSQILRFARGAGRRNLEAVFGLPASSR